MSSNNMQFPPLHVGSGHQGYMPNNGAHQAPQLMNFGQYILNNNGPSALQPIVNPIYVGSPHVHVLTNVAHFNMPPVGAYQNPPPPRTAAPANAPRSQASGPSTHAPKRASAELQVPAAAQQARMDQSSSEFTNYSVEKMRETSERKSTYAQISKRTKTAKVAFRCLRCKATETPEKRNGPKGPQTLCNKCGLRYARKLKAAQEMKVKMGFDRILN